MGLSALIEHTNLWYGHYERIGEDILNPEHKKNTVHTIWTVFFLDKENYFLKPNFAISSR